MGSASLLFVVELLVFGDGGLVLVFSAGSGLLLFGVGSVLLAFGAGLVLCLCVGVAGSVLKLLFRGVDVAALVLLFFQGLLVLVLGLLMLMLGLLVCGVGLELIFRVGVVQSRFSVFDVLVFRVAGIWAMRSLCSVEEHVFCCRGWVGSGAWLLADAVFLRL